ncbi:peroxidase 29-like [Capsicum annuum]|uniref:peroxidase 29-like n=1 Tax=Capsicum annuum TaxID=4072 RepID=UPI001FB1587F|nr:peroxidase 29-like [Capsicum annuum]
MAHAAREAISVSVGPRIDIPLGRRDSSNLPNSSLADSSLPPPNLGVDHMLRLFAQKGLSLEESISINDFGRIEIGICHDIRFPELGPTLDLYVPYVKEGVKFAEVLEKMRAEVTWTENSVMVKEPPRNSFWNETFACH